jgi:hypothetical protein
MIDGNLNNFFSLVYINAGLSKQWKFFKGSYFFGPSYCLKGYRYFKTLNPDDNRTYRKVEHALGIYQNASLVVMPFKHFGFGVAGNVNLCKTVDSKGWQIVLEYSH